MSASSVRTVVAEPQKTRSRFTVGRIVAVLAVLTLLVLGGRQAAPHVLDFAAWVERLGAWKPAVFVVGYVVAVVAFVPASLLTIAAGTIFQSLWTGVAYVFVAAVLGSSAAFLIGRYVARGAVERRLAGNARFAAIDRAVGAEGRKIVFLLRLSPIFPFSLLNYALGLTRVRFADYLLASIGMIPGTFLYVYFGTLAREVYQLAGGAAVQKGAGYYVVLTLGVVATFAVVAVVTRTARRALRTATGD